MASSIEYKILRIALLCLAACAGYVAVYIPLMILFFDKRVPLIFWLILALSLSTAAALARLADRWLPKG